MYRSPEQPLTLQQRQQSESRIMHDAALISKGAFITKHGVLHISDVQLELLINTGNSIEVTGESPDMQYEVAIESEKHQWLGTSLKQLDTCELDISERTRLALLRSGVYSIRHLYTLGRKKIAITHGIGKKAITEIDAFLRPGERFNIQWVDRPTIEEMTKYCATTKDIPADVLDDMLTFQLRQDTRGMSVHDMSNLSLQELVDHNRYFDWKSIGAYRRAAEQYTARFEAAQQQKVHYSPPGD